MEKEVKTEEFKIVEVKDGVYVKDYEMTTPIICRLLLTNNINEAHKWNIHADTIKKVKDHSFGTIKRLKIVYNIEEQKYGVY